MLIKELQSLGLDVRVQDVNGDEIDLKQNFDDEEPGFEGRELPGDDVLLESELNDDYSIEEADEGFGSDEEPEPGDDLFGAEGSAGGDMDDLL